MGRTREKRGIWRAGWEISSIFFFLQKTNDFHRLLLGEFYGKQVAFRSFRLERNYRMIKKQFGFFPFSDCHFFSSFYLCLKCT